MMTKRLFFILLTVVLSFAPVSSLSAQTNSQAAAAYNHFVRLISSNSSQAAYPALMESYQAYSHILSNSSEGSLDYLQAKTALKNMHPYLEKGAFYYTGKNDQQKALQFMQAFMDVALLPCMIGEGLQQSVNYVQLVKTTAGLTWRNGDYERAIPYMQAYLDTGDTELRQTFYAFLGQAYTKKQDYTQARRVLEEGLRQYPNGKDLLLAIIANCQKSHDDTGLESFLPRAIALTTKNDPNMAALLKMLGMHEEKNEHYEQAFEAFFKLDKLRPNELYTVHHLAMNCFNAGVKYFKLSKEVVNRNSRNQYAQKASDYFSQAEPFLCNLMASEALEVKYPQALATVYSCLGEKEKLAAINKKLVAAGYEPIDNEMQAVSLMQEKNNSVAPTPRRQPVAQTTIVSSSEKQAAMMGNQAKPSSPSPQQPKTPQAISDVDINIPVGTTNNSNTFAVIIANEKYKKVAQVPMAANDGHVMAAYCQKVLGIPETNIRAYYDATALDMSGALDDIKLVAEAYHGNLNIIFYFSGHGVPDEKTRDAFLLPIDANGQSTYGLMSLGMLYGELGATQARCVTVFLDACFSGSQRGDGMLVSARSVVRKAKAAEPQGNMVVFSAATGDETAFPYKEKGHGMFTYFLLKKLQESKGNCTLQELSDYIQTQVKKQSVVINRKSQTPTVVPSVSVADNWKMMKLK